MSENFLHGAEVVEINDGTRTISTVRSSVIGVVGTAPDSAPEVKATLATGAVGSNNALTYTAKLNGALGNGISVHQVDPRANDATLQVTVSGKAIRVSLATGATGTITSTAAQVLAAVQANTAAAALVTVANTGASTGAGVVTASFRPTSLAGGEDEAFPLNKPVLVPADKTLAAKLGKAGTLFQAMKGIFAQTGAVVVVVRVEEGEDEAETMANVAGGIEAGTGVYKGAYAFLGSETANGFCPRILIAPGWTHQYDALTQANPVVAQLQGVANRLRAVVIADGPNTNDADAIQARQNYGGKRVYFHDVHYTVQDDDGAIIDVPASSYIAGLIARVDNEEGFWVSPSNHEIYGILGTARPIDFVLGDSSSRANLLNEQEVATTIRKDGFRLWGNRTTSIDPKFAFVSVVRTADMINDSILRAHMWAVDRNITRTYFEDVAAGVNAYGSRLQAQGAIAGLECWPTKDLNTAENIAAGRAYWDFEFSAYAPGERLTFRSLLSNRFLEEII
jgi:hypothetical protein